MAEAETRSAEATRVRGRIGRYRVLSRLGEGGMGVVHLAHDETLGRRVALKQLAPGLAENATFRERFIRESRLAASIDHPHIVPVYESGEADATLFIAMRYVEGPDLRELLVREGPFAPDRSTAIAGQVAGALDAAHTVGLVHRDVKPANVLIDHAAGEHCYLSDFGLTKNLAASSGFTETGQFVGTVSYMAPEQIAGATVDGRADVYALACLVYELLSGQPPFRRPSDVALMYAHLHDPPPSIRALRPELPPGCDEVLARGLAKEPVDRYATCGLFVDDLRAALAGRPMPSFTPGISARRFVRPQPVAEPPPVISSPPRAPPPQPQPAPPRYVPPPAAPPPAPRPEEEGSSHLPAALIVAAAIVLCAGGIAAALILSRDSGPSDLSNARDLLRRTVQLDTHLTDLATRLQAEQRADAAIQAQLAADERQAAALQSQVNAQLRRLTQLRASIARADADLQTASRRLARYNRSHRAHDLDTALSSLSDANAHERSAGTQLAAASAQHGKQPAATVHGGRISLPGAARASISSGGIGGIGDVSSAGDINGDGKADLVVSAHEDGPAGYVFVVFGSTRAHDVNLASLGRDGFEITGAESGWAAGDLNGDHLGDVVVVGAPTGTSPVPTLFVVYGSRHPASIDLTQGVPPGSGREIDLSASEKQSTIQDGVAQLNAHAAGDVNHDGIGDLVIGDPLADGDDGAAYVVFGARHPGTLSVDSLGSGGFKISGRGSLGGSVAGAGDVNNDGFDDVVVGAPSAGSGSRGAAYVVYGSRSPADVSATNLGGGGFAITGDAPGGHAGEAVAGAGDVNGDHHADVAVAEPSSSPLGRASAGTAFVVFGGRAGDAALAHLGDGGYEILGAAPARQVTGAPAMGLGASMASAGDLDGDGVPDLILGAATLERPSAIAYVVYGRPKTSTVDLASPSAPALAIDGPRSTAGTPAIAVGGGVPFGDSDDVFVAPAGANQIPGPQTAYAVGGNR